MPVLADTKVMPDYLRNTYRQIRPYLEEPYRSPESAVTGGADG
jgi:hypothetical protein